MLVKKQNDQGHTVYPSDAILLKSKIKGLPEGAMIEALDWDTIFAAEPVLTRPPDYDAQVTNGNGNGTPNGVPREEDGHDEEEAVTLVEEETPFAPGDGD
jgi:hypothetical protein